MLFINTYNKLCESRKSNKQFYKPGSNLHKHHIIPTHCGGLDEESNFTYLTIREHIIAHYCLWRINKNPNDLRSMKMLGAKLTSLQRKATGIWCKENKIGFFSDKFSSKERREWRLKGANVQMKNKVGIFDNTLFSYHASLGGKASIISLNNPWSYWASKEGQLKRASLGGKSLIGMKCVTNGKHRTRIKADCLEEYLSKGYRLGFTLD